MNARHFLIGTLLFLTVGSTQAQVDVHVGITSGYAATFISDNGISKSPRYNSVMTYNWTPIGVSAGVDFTRKFGLTLEAISTRQGQSYEIIDIADKVVGQREISLSYLQIPLMLKFMNEGNSAVRGNFSVGPQIALLNAASDKMQYTASTQTFPAGASLPVGSNGIRQRPDGNVQANVPALAKTEMMSKSKGNFNKISYEVAAAFGFDVDITRHLYLSLQLRGFYNFTDMRDDAIIKQLKSGETNDVYGRRSNFQIGALGGLHYMFDSTRSFRYKGSKPKKVIHRH